MLKKEVAALERELDAYGACDPVKAEEKRKAVSLAHEAAIRWTGTSDECIRFLLYCDGVYA